MCGVAPPQALYQGGGWTAPPDHVLLPLLLLHLNTDIFTKKQKMLLFSETHYSVFTFNANPEPRIPAGSAKKEMPKRAQKQAITFPFQVTGT